MKAPDRREIMRNRHVVPLLVRAVACAWLVHGWTSLLAAGSTPGLAGWTPAPPAWKDATVSNETATLTARKWAYLMTPASVPDVEVSAIIQVREVGKLRSFFGESWSVWPDKAVDDHGWDAGLLLRATDGGGYRVQVSASLAEVAVVKFPSGGYVRSVPVIVGKDSTLALTARARANRVTVTANGREVISFIDPDPLGDGKVGIGANSGAMVEFRHVAVTPLESGAYESPPAHQPRFRARRWVGGRQWVFDGDEPILLLPDPASSFVNNVKLRPGLRPLLGFNSHWDVQAQGAYPDARNDTTDVKVDGGGRELGVSWVGKHEKNRFRTRSRMTVGWDDRRSVYTYDIESELEVLAGEPFPFRNGLDFEHHTPLDPFNWQYLVFRKADGSLRRRPVYPVDPGVQGDLGMADGLRVWHGRHNDPVPICPAVEYRTPDTGGRKLNTAVCAAFYDTGVSFPAETLKPAQKISVRYRYTGYPAAEAAMLFNEARTVEGPMFDPGHHYIFAEWPRTTFSQFVALSDSWIYGRVPFMSAHNGRPTYELAKAPETKGGHAMRLGPLASGAAPLPLPAGGLAPGRYVLSVQAMGDNLFGPGGRIELTAADPSGKPRLNLRHFVGAGTFGWRQAGLAFDLPDGIKTLTLGFGNGGTGHAFFTDAEFRLLKPGDPLPKGIASTANPVASMVSPSPQGAIMDYRMVEGRGMHALDFASGPLGVLELANTDWVPDEGRPALRFADNTGGTGIYPKAGALDSGYFGHPAYKGRETIPVAVAGHHGRDALLLGGFTIVSWVKPAATMGKAEHGGTGDIVGIGARRMVLRLVGQSAPYQLQGALDVTDRFTTPEAMVEAGRWHQVAMSGEPTTGNAWRVRLCLDGKTVLEGRTQKRLDPFALSPSVVLGAELFYFHNGYYRGLIGRTLLFDRPLTAHQIAVLRAVE